MDDLVKAVIGNEWENKCKELEADHLKLQIEVGKLRRAISILLDNMDKKKMIDLLDEISVARFKESQKRGD